MSSPPDITRQVATNKDCSTKENTMGYDFMFMRVREKTKRSFPLDSSLITESDCEGQLPWSEFRTWLLSIGGKENGGRDSIWVDYADGMESINFNGGGNDASTIYLDVHAHWARIVEAFSQLELLDPDAVIFDLQTGEFHNLSTFRIFIAENYCDG